MRVTDHGHDRAAHPADDIRHNIHNGIQTVGGTDDHHTDHAHGNNFRILIVESKQRIAKAVGDKAEDLRKEDAQGQAPKGDAPRSLYCPAPRFWLVKVREACATELQLVKRSLRY